VEIAIILEQPVLETATIPKNTDTFTPFIRRIITEVIVLTGIVPCAFYFDLIPHNEFYPTTTTGSSTPSSSDTSCSTDSFSKGIIDSCFTGEPKLEAEVVNPVLQAIMETPDVTTGLVTIAEVVTSGVLFFNII